MDVTEKIVELMNDKHEFVFDPTLHADIIKAATEIKVRSLLIKRGIMLEIKDGAPLRAVLVSSASATKPAPKAPTPTTAPTPATASKPTTPPAPRADYVHKFILPKFFPEMKAVLACGKDWVKNSSVNVRLVGPKGCGKTELVREAQKICGFDWVYQINGRSDMDSSDFFGDRTVAIDEKSMQNFCTFMKGQMIRAMQHGTKVDAAGNQILEDGEAVVEGAPAILFIDEYAAIPADVFLSVCNRLMEIPREPGKGRTIEVTADGGRVVKSHPGFVVILAGNTLGKGLEDDTLAGYTGQGNIQDDSTLDRIVADFQMGYSDEAERQILMGYLSDDELADKIIKFRDQVRNLWVQDKVESLLSTRGIKAFAQLCNLYLRGNISEAAGKALWRTLFSGLRPMEKPAWNEVARNFLGVDLMKKYGTPKGMWMPIKAKRV